MKKLRFECGKCGKRSMPAYNKASETYLQCYDVDDRRICSECADSTPVWVGFIQFIETNPQKPITVPDEVIANG